VKTKDKTFDKNKKDWEEYLKNPKDIFDKDIKTKNPDISYSRLKFDLHGFTLLEANKKVSELILRCVEKKYTEILLITGKGIHSNNDQEIYVSKDLSKLRYAIPDFIETTEYLKNKVIDISIADKKDGGEGALVIKLKKL
jgi:DNA-nicking Smr family endonuclease